MDMIRYEGILNLQVERSLRLGIQGIISGILVMPYFIKSFATGDNTKITTSQDSLIVSILYDFQSPLLDWITRI